MNWMRWKVASMLSASDETVRVLARPGTPSSRTCPPVSRPMRSRSIMASCPTTRLCSSRLIRGASSRLDGVPATALPCDVVELSNPASSLSGLRPRASRYARRGTSRWLAGAPRCARRERACGPRPRSNLLPTTPPTRKVRAHVRGPPAAKPPPAASRSRGAAARPTSSPAPRRPRSGRPRRPGGPGRSARPRSWGSRSAREPSLGVGPPSRSSRIDLSRSRQLAQFDGPQVDPAVLRQARVLGRLPRLRDHLADRPAALARRRAGGSAGRW